MGEIGKIISRRYPDFQKIQWDQQNERLFNLKREKIKWIYDKGDVIGRTQESNCHCSEKKILKRARQR